MLCRLFALAALVAVGSGARADDPPEALRAVGTVTAKRVKVAAGGMGFVQTLNVREGDTVKLGAVVAMLDAAKLQDDLRLAEAKLKAAEAKIKVIRDEQTSVVAEAEANLQKANAHLERLKKAVASGVGSGIELREAEATATVAKARLEDARRDKGLVARAELGVTAAELEQVKRALDRCSIRAPMDGVVVRVLTNVGEFVQPTGGIVEVADLQRPEVLVNVAEAQLDRLAVGQNCSVTLGGMKDVFAGKVASIAPVIDPKTRTAVVRVSLAPPNRLLRPGSTATVAFLKADK